MSKASYLELCHIEIMYVVFLPLGPFSEKDCFCKVLTTD